MLYNDNIIEMCEQSFVHVISQSDLTVSGDARHNGQEFYKQNAGAERCVC